MALVGDSVLSKRYSLSKLDITSVCTPIDVVLGRCRGTMAGADCLNFGDSVVGDSIDVDGIVVAVDGCAPPMIDVGF